MPMPDVYQEKHLHHAFYTSRNLPPAEEAEIALFKKLQANFAAQFESVFPDKLAPKTVVIVPSFTLDQQILSKIDGIVHYEERMLCLLLLLRMPRTHVIYVTSNTIDPVIIDYYLHLLPGVSAYHARQRLTLLSCYDSSPRPLTEKILERPRLIQRIRNSIPFDHLAHLTCFNITPLERSLAVQLQIPVYGCDPDLYPLGNKSNSRKLFKTCGLHTPDGYEDLQTEDDIVEAVLLLKQKNPSLRKAVVKMNEGFSGEGNAIFNYESSLSAGKLKASIKAALRSQLKIVAKDLLYDEFVEKFVSMGGIVEEFIEGVNKKSPSVQCRINPLGKCDILSTHDQLLSGESGQVFMGAYFPASQDYAVEIGGMAMCVAQALQQKGVIGRFGIDFLSIKNETGWKHYALEINLRKGGTTHPYLMLQFLTDGHYQADTGIYYTANHQPRFYFTTDNLQNSKYKGLTPHDLVDIAIQNNLLYNGATQQGVMFHLIGALSQYGKLGLVAIGETWAQAEKYYQKTVEVLDRES